jgi:hypothetical protein
MTEHPKDPAGTTHEFQAFASQGQAEPATAGGKTGLILGLVAVAVVVVVVAVVAFVL